MNPCKAVAVKAEVENLLKVGFIYPIALTEWVSNPVPIDKKQGTICVCTDFRDLLACFSDLGQQGDYSHTISLKQRPVCLE